MEQEKHKKQQQAEIEMTWDEIAILWEKEHGWKRVPLNEKERLLKLRKRVLKKYSVCTDCNNHLRGRAYFCHFNNKKYCHRCYDYFCVTMNGIGENIDGYGEDISTR